MARRAFLHVGVTKSGTSYLQSLWWRNREALAGRGLLLPGADIGDHFHAASLVCERAAILDRMPPRRRRVWDDLLAEVEGWAGDALISHELFSPATPVQAAEALRRLAEVAGEVHVVATARDLARQLPSTWQQHVKRGGTESLTDYWEQLRAEDPAGGFWLYQDLPALLARWSQGLPGDRVHLVVQPPSGTTSPDWLWHHTCELLGVDPAGLDTTTARANESLGIVEVEVMRRLHGMIPPEDHDLDTIRTAKGWFTRNALVPAGAGERFVLDPAMQEWAVVRGEAMVSQLSGRDYDVVGDLAHLAPVGGPGEGRTTDLVSDSEVAEVAVAALARMVVRERDRHHEVDGLRAQRRRLRKDAARRDRAGAGSARATSAASRLAGLVHRLRGRR